MMSYHTISEKPWTIPEEQATYLFDDFNGNESVAVARYHHLRSLAAIDPTMRYRLKMRTVFGLNGFLLWELILGE